MVLVDRAAIKKYWLFYTQKNKIIDRHREIRVLGTVSTERGKDRVLVPVPEADLERVGLAVGERGERVDPPLGEPRRGLHPVAHPHRRRRDSCGDLIDSINDYQQLRRLPRIHLLLSHDPLSSSTPCTDTEVGKRGQRNREPVEESSKQSSQAIASKLLFHME